ncbi:MAG TPA: PQQ-binding-like beta-propeller repeat protein, partial [Thermomicrobiales bacterium]|nr:PQQ-binding-like beta-propeller repeat protein [Thermomicrobiales bacterium]
MTASQKVPSRSFAPVTFMSRRKLLAGTGASLGAAGLAALIARIPGAAQEQTGTSPATPNVLSGTPVPPEVSQYAGDWPVAQGNLAGTRAAANATINASNIDSLTTAWTVPITVSGNFSGITANAVILDGTVYLQDMASNVFALDRETGKELWHTDFNVPSNGPNGVAVAYDRVYAATGDTSVVFCLDAKSGELIWENDVSNNDFECIDMAPLVYDNIVYISTNPNNVSHGNYRGGARGILFALDAASGVTLWQFDTATDNLWGNPRTNSGAGLWYPPSVDDKGNLYFGTGNPGPYPGNEEYPNGTSRPGPNDYADSIVSLDPATGAVRWHVNANPHDLMDHDFQHTPVLATVKLNDTDTLIAVGAGKTGTVIAAAADSGALLWETEVGKHENDKLQELPPGTTRIYPGGLGGVESPIAFGDGKIFVPYIDFPMYLTPTNSDSTAGGNIDEATGGFAAIDAATGQIVWDNKVDAIVVAGATVVNDVVLSGSLDGYLRAYDLKTGDTVWEFQASAGLNAPPAVAGDLIVFAAGAPIFSKPGVSAEATPGGPAGV